MPDPTLSPNAFACEQASSTDRREEVRFPCRPGVELRFLVKPSFRSRRGYLKDISSVDAVLNVSQAVEEGAVVLLELPTGPRGETTLRVAHVVSVWQHPVGYWLVSCSFVHRLADRQVFGALRNGW
jgi:hypothetical protein